MNNSTKRLSLSDKLSMLTKITDDIYKVVVRYPFDMFEMNSYFIRGDKGFTVIDTGSEAKESLALWERIIASGLIIEKLVITHAHPDHLGLAKWLQKQHQVPVFISNLGYKEMQRIRNKDNPNWISHLFKKHDSPIFENMGSLETKPYEFEPDGLFENHQKISLGNDMFETIWTPGHSSDQFCFYNQNKQVMVTGDHVLGGISPIVAAWSEDERNPLENYFTSLDRIKTYPTKQGLPGHGELIVNLNSRIDEIISGHIHRFQQILVSVKDEEKTSGQVCQEIYGSLRINKVFPPLMATITRFIYLESLGKVSSELKNGKVYYRSNTK